MCITPAGMAQFIECHPRKQKVASLIPRQGTCLGYGHKRGNQLMFLSHISVSLPFFVSPPLSKK